MSSSETSNAKSKRRSRMMIWILLSIDLWERLRAVWFAWLSFNVLTQRVISEAFWVLCGDFSEKSCLLVAVIAVVAIGGEVWCHNSGNAQCHVLIVRLYLPDSKARCWYEAAHSKHCRQFDFVGDLVVAFLVIQIEQLWPQFEEHLKIAFTLYC